MPQNSICVWGNLWGSWPPPVYLQEKAWNCTGPWCTPKGCYHVILKSTFKKVSPKQVWLQPGCDVISIWAHSYCQKYCILVMWKSEFTAAALSFKHTSGFERSHVFSFSNQHLSSSLHSYAISISAAMLFRWCPARRASDICQTSFSLLLLFSHFHHAVRIQTVERLFSLLFRW